MLNTGDGKIRCLVYFTFPVSGKRKQTRYSFLNFTGNTGHSQITTNVKRKLLFHRATCMENEEHARSLSNSASWKPIITTLNHWVEGGIKGIKCSTVCVWLHVIDLPHVGQWTLRIACNLSHSPKFILWKLKHFKEGMVSIVHIRKFQLSFYIQNANNGFSLSFVISYEVQSLPPALHIPLWKLSETRFSNCLICKR